MLNVIHISGFLNSPNTKIAQSVTHYDPKFSKLEVALFLKNFDLESAYFPYEKI